MLPIFLYGLEGELIGLVGSFPTVAGPNRPPARVRLYEAASEAGGAEEDPYGRMIHATQERGCVLSLQHLWNYDYG